MAVAEPPATPAPPPTDSPPDEWRARDRNEQELLRRWRQMNFRAGRSETAVLNWNGATLIVMTTVRVR